MVRKRSRVRVPPSAPASPQGEPRNTLHKPQGVCFNACGSAFARVTRSATTESRSSRHARKYHFFLAISSRNSVCFSATVYRAFFIFQNFKNQSTKFNWLSEKRPLAVRHIVKIRLNFSKFHLPFPTCPNRPKTPYFSPIGYIWLSGYQAVLSRFVIIAFAILTC